MKVAVLISVSGRIEEALECISGVYRQSDSLAGEGKYSIDIFLNDDTGEEGFSEMVAARFPDVRTVRSQERLFSCRGLRLAWQEAAVRDYDFYLWLDPCLSLCEGAFGTLLENSNFLRHEAIIAGSVSLADGGLIHGGRTRSGKLIQPDAVIPVPCTFFDGNLVLVPRHAFNVLGPVDAEFQQELGFWDYGIRAVRAGISRVISPGILATSTQAPGIPAWQDSSLSFKERYRSLRSPEGRPFGQQFTYDIRSRGLLFAIWGFIKLNLRTIFALKRK